MSSPTQRAEREVVPEGIYLSGRSGDVELLSVFGTDAVTLANNHVYDYGEEGLLSTLDCLRKADIPYTGAGENRKEASKILSFCD